MARNYYPRSAALLLGTLIVLIGLLDYRSGYRFSLFPLYLISVAIVAWFDRMEKYWQLKAPQSRESSGKGKVAT